MTYQVVSRTVRTKGRKTEGWSVLCPGGHYANDTLYTDRTEAEKHCEILEAFYGKKTMG